MSKTKIGILSLIIAAALCLTAGLCFAFMPAGASSAISPSGVFTVSGGAERTDYNDMQAEQDYYLTYRLPADGASVNFQRNLALKWYGFAGEEGTGYTLASASEAKYFTLSLHFRDLNFQTFTLTMESTQMSQSKEGKTVNEIVFTNNDGALTAAANGSETVATIDVTDNQADVTIEFSENPSEVGYGDFVVTVNDQPAGEFTNIGLYYARYASSTSDTPILPLSFTAEGITGESGTSFEVRSLNGQSFLLTENNEITDDTAPVVVVNTEIKQFLMGDKNFLDSDNYTVIDVCSSSRTPTLHYYIQNPAEADAEADPPALTKGESGDYELTGYTEADTDQVFFEDDFKGTEGYISVAFELSDNNGNTMYSFYEWYVDSAAKSQPIDGRSYIVMLSPEDERVSSYPETSFYSVEKMPDSDYYTVSRESAANDYRAVVEAASKQADGTTSIQVGTGAYFYLPSLRPYVQDQNSGFTQLTFTIYYRTATSDTSTVSGSYDELSIEVAQEGTYQFRIVPTNRAGKAMFGYIETSEGSDQYEQVEITSDNVWECANLETFEFTVKYNGPSIEEAEDGDIGYRDLEYTVDDFEVIAVGTPKKEYTLFYFEVSGSSTPTLDQLREAIDNGTDDTLGTWREIAVYDTENEDASDNDYEWYRDESLSFIPQRIGIYKVTIEVSDFKTGDTPVQSYKLISIASDPDTVDVGGDPLEWLQDNVLSVVFLGIGVLCLIGIVVLLLVKPKDAAAVEAEKARKEEIRKKRENRK